MNLRIRTLFYIFFLNPDYVAARSLRSFRITYNLHLARKYARILVFFRGHYLSREANSFPRGKLEENCEVRGTDNVQGQSEHIFATNGGCCLYYPSNLFRNAQNFEIWEYLTIIRRSGGE